TLSPNAKKLIENGWNYTRAGACPGLTAGTGSWTGDVETVKHPGYIEDTTGLTGTIPGAKASGVLTDIVSCPGKRFKWTARATKPLSAQAPRYLRPSALKCKKPGIHYAGKTSQGAKICFTISSDG